jgi:RNA polymerase sigma-70 factor (sigma-E family)
MQSRCLSESLTEAQEATGGSVTFDEFAATRLDAVLRFAVVLTNDKGLAEDVVQEVLIRAHQRWAQIGAMEYPEAYVRRMVVNEFLSWRRKWARYVPQADVDPGIRTEDHAETQAERSALLAEVAKLPRRQRAVLVLRYYEGLSDAQIAEVLGCAETTVRGYAFRGLAALRIEMKSAELR